MKIKLTDSQVVALGYDDTGCPVRQGIRAAKGKRELTANELAILREDVDQGHTFACDPLAARAIRGLAKKMA